MRERIISICLLLFAALTIWLITAELPQKDYAKPASDFTEAVRNGTTTSATLSSSTTTSAAAPKVADEVIRLHILADSDSERDQTIKLALRDVLLPYLNAATLGAGTKDAALSLLTSQCETFAKVANTFLAEQNAGYTATVSVERVYFPIRIYGSQTYLSKDAVIFPPGFYDSVQVILGSGEGHNWWCLAYPSLCFIDSSYDYLPKDSDIYKLKIGTMEKRVLEELFYGEPGFAATNTAESEIDIYFGSKLWELLKTIFEKNVD